MCSNCAIVKLKQMSSSNLPSMAKMNPADRKSLVAALGFPILVLIGGLVGYAAPSATTTLKPWVSPMLGLVMFGMGLTLNVKDFQLVARRPLPVLIGVLAQFVIMPLAAVGVVWILDLPPEIAVGVILVGCCPGGTSSNVVTFLARGDVALSVAMTTVSTLLAPLLTPALTLWLASEHMSVSASAMSLDIVKVVLVPVIGGLILGYFAPSLVKFLQPILPWISVLAISTIVSIVVGGSKSAIATAGAVVLAAVILHNLLGFLLGYAVGLATKQEVSVRRTITIEVGLQNSGLATSLATAYLNPLAALPGALFSVWHNLSGAVLAAMFRYRDTRTAGMEESEG